MLFDATKIAIVAHEANRAYCSLLGDFTSPPWELLDTEMRASIIDGVVGIMQGAITSPKQAHENWVTVKQADGWTVGKKKDLKTKEHPSLLPYSQLPREEQKKDELFFAVVTALLK